MSACRADSALLMLDNFPSTLGTDNDDGEPFTRCISANLNPVEHLVITEVNVRRNKPGQGNDTRSHVTA